MVDGHLSKVGQALVKVGSQSSAKMGQRSQNQLKATTCTLSICRLASPKTI